MKTFLGFIATLALVAIAICCFITSKIFYHYTNSPCVTNCQGNQQSDVFIWKSYTNAETVDPANIYNSTYTTKGLYATNNSGIGRHQGLTGLAPLHRSAEIVDISFIKLGNTVVVNPPTGSIDLELVVFDHFGNVLRTISSSPVDFSGTAPRTWRNIPVSGNLVILPGEVVNARLNFTPVPANSGDNYFYQLSAMAILR